MKKKIDAEEYQINRKKDITPYEKLRDMLSTLLGKQIVIRSNLERVHGNTEKVFTLYHIKQEYSELGQVLILENPTLEPEKCPRIAISHNMQIEKKDATVIIRYLREVSFKQLVKRTVPDLEIYIEEKK